MTGRRRTLATLTLTALVAGLATWARTGTAGPVPGEVRPTAARRAAPPPVARPVPDIAGSARLGPLLVEPDDGQGPVDRFIARARRSVELTMYELADPAAEAALMADAARGVEVRVLLDRADAGAAVNAPAAAALAAAGVHVTWAPAGELLHQKTVTVDGTASLVMTGNLTARDEPATRDLAVVDTGHGDVAAIETTFAADVAGVPPAAGGPGTDLLWSPGSEGALLHLVDSARHTVVAESGEMDSPAVETALEGDARRGVDVDVVMSDSPSWWPAFGALAAAGVHVHVYRGESPRYIHAKAVLVDGGRVGQRAFVGSQNFSTASMRYDRELGVVTSDPAVLSRLGSVLSGDVRGAAPWT